MAVWNIIQRSGTAERLDPEYYQPRFLGLADELAATDPVCVDDIAYVTDGIHGSPEWVGEGGITYLSAKCVKDNYFDLAKAGHISDRQHLSNPRTQARIGDVLLTTVGTIGNAAVVREDILPANMDRHLGIIRIRRDDVDPYYLSTFLNSTFGKFQTIREATGNVQLNLFIDKIKRLRVPLIEADYHGGVAALTRAAYDRRRESDVMYREAEAVMLDDLGVSGVDMSPHTTYMAALHLVAAVRRLDAEYFQPKYYRLLDAMKVSGAEELRPLGEMLETITNGHTPLRHDLGVGDVPFLTAEHVDDFRIDLDSDKRILTKHHEGELGRTRLRDGDILVTIKGRIGNAALVEHLTGPANINQDVALLRLKPGYHPYYVAGFLNSPMGKLLIEQTCTGQINPFLGLGKLREIPVPIFDKGRMDELGEHVQGRVDAAYRAHQESRRLLEQAEHQIAQTITGGATAS